MFRISLPRNLAQRSPIVASGAFGSKLASKPNDSISAAVNYGRQSTLAIGRSPSPPRSKLNVSSTQKRKGRTISNDIERDPKRRNRTAYRNKHGEEIKSTPCDPPPGYVFVPSGDWFVTRHCRKLAQTLYAVYRPKSRKELGGQIGFYVPREVLEKVESKYKANQAKIEEQLAVKTAKVEAKLQRALDKSLRVLGQEHPDTLTSVAN